MLRYDKVTGSRTVGEIFPRMQVSSDGELTVNPVTLVVTPLAVITKKTIFDFTRPSLRHV